MRLPAFAVFIGLRTVLLVATGAVLYLFGLRGAALLILAVLISSALSLPLLSRRRDAVSSRISERVERTRRKLDEAAASDDE